MDTGAGLGHSKPRVLPRAPILPGARGRARAAAASEGAEPANGCAARGANVTGPPSCSTRSGGKLRFWFFFPSSIPVSGLLELVAHRLGHAVFLL